jgi:signal transduction histidine kinase/CheY-like chemotaxis protein
LEKVKNPADFFSMRGLLQTTREVPAVAVAREPTSEIRPVGQAHLVGLMGVAANRSFPLHKGALTLGRAPECNGWIPECDVSRRHAHIEERDGRYVLRDLGSRNGTRVNGTAVQECVLELGDVISIGADTVLIFSRHDPLRDRLLQLQKMETVGRLAGGVAHDFNELLSVVLNNVDFCEGHDDPEERHRCAAEIRGAAQRGAELTRRLLDFARLGMREQGNVDLSQLLEDAIALCRYTFDASVALQAEIEPELQVHGDRLLLYQLFMNLLVNSHEAVSDHGRITIHAARAPEHGNAVVTITDDGHGMEPDTRSQIFQPFFSRKEGGSGLGLAIARGIVADHRGTIDVESTPGRGCSFRVVLPLAAARVCSRSIARRTPTVELRPVRGRVLVVDDDKLVRKSTVRQLRAMGYETLQAENGREAVEIYREEKESIDVVLLDQIMPEMNGREAFHQLQALNPKVRVVLFSGFEEEGSIQELLEAGACCFLAKPVAGADLSRAIRKALKSAD